MAKTLEYDEKGQFFGYFCMAIFGVILMPLTYYIYINYIKKEQKKDDKAKKCDCEECKTKYEFLNKKPNNRRQQIFVILLTLAIWSSYFYMGFKFLKYKPVAPITTDTIFNPFLIMGIEEGTPLKEIKAAYRKLALKLHPDRGGDVDDYVKLTKAYTILTDDTARANWEKYGNPDGPQETSIGIALPSWLISKKNSRIVLLVYFMVILLGVPIAVAIWWYRSKKYFNKVLLAETIQMYCYFIKTSPDMVWKRIFLILCGSFEFSPQYCSYMKMDPNHYAEMATIVNKLNFKNKEKKEAIFNQPYVYKARILLYSFLEKLPLSSKTLERQQQLFLQQFITLLGEFINILTSFFVYAKIGQISKGPSTDTLVNSMKLCARVIQGLYPGASSLLQLPHVDKDKLETFLRRKKSLKTVQNFVSLPEKDRALVLKEFDEKEIKDIYLCIESMPHLDISLFVQVGDEVNPSSIEMGSLVTIIVLIQRTPLSSKLGTVTKIDTTDRQPSNMIKRKTNKKYSQVSTANEVASTSTELEECESEDASSKAEKDSSYPKSINIDDGEPGFFVHAPSYPCQKKEGWWIYIINKKDNTLEVGPTYFYISSSCNKHMSLQICPPPINGMLDYICCIQSDSYIDFQYEAKFSIHIIEPLPKIDEPQWDLSEEEVEDEVLTDSEEAPLASQTSKEKDT